MCQNDVADLLQPQCAAYPGSSTGWYGGYGYDGYGFTSGRMAPVTQLGYPACLDNGQNQIRNDAYVSIANFDNAVIGSLMCGGSSGGPWLVNFGVRPALTGTTAGTAANPNVVIGVTSWGYTSAGPNEMGARPVTSSNINALVDGACAASPAA